MIMSNLIPETGQSLAVARIHPVSYIGVINLIRGMIDKICELDPNLEGSDVYKNVLVFFCVNWIRNYLLIIHFNHYQRLNVDTGGWTPAKGRNFYSLKIPEAIISIARHIARPRLLIDGSVSLPSPGIDTGSMSLFTNITEESKFNDFIVVGPPDGHLFRNPVVGEPVVFLRRIHPYLLNQFGRFNILSLRSKEGLVPARIGFFDSELETYHHLLDETNKFDASIIRFDTLLSPIIIDCREGKNGEVPDYPVCLQWLGNDLAQGLSFRYPHTKYVIMRTCLHEAPDTITREFVLKHYLSMLTTEYTDWNFPKLGIQAEINDLRTLVNDLGLGVPGNKRNQRRQQRIERSNDERKFKHEVQQLANVVSVTGVSPAEEESREVKASKNAKNRKRRLKSKRKNKDTG